MAQNNCRQKTKTTNHFIDNQQKLEKHNQIQLSKSEPVPSTSISHLN